MIRFQRLPNLPVHSLSFKLTAFVAILVLPLVALQATNHYYGVRARLSEQQEQSERSASSLNETFMWYVNQLWKSETHLGMVILSQQASQQQITVYLSHMQMRQPEIVDLLWLAPNGRVEVSLSGNKQVITGTRPYIPQSTDKPLATISEALQVKPDSPPVFAISQGIVSKGQLAGIMVAYIDPAKVLASLPWSGKNNGSAVLVDPNGILAAAFGTSITGNVHLNTNSPLRVALTGVEVRLPDITLPGTSGLLGTAVPISDTGWAVFVGYPRQQIIRDVAHIAIHDIVSIVLVTFFSIAGALYITNSLLRRAQALKEAALAVANGDKHIRLQVGGKDELSAMSNAFNHMLDRIQDLETELNTFFTVSPDLFAITDKDGHLLNVNPAWENTLEHTKVQLLNESYFNLVHPDDRAATQSELRQLKISPVALSYENRIRCGDGSYRWVLWTAFEKKGKIYAVGHDITERRNIEQKRLDILMREQVVRSEAEASRQRFAFLAEASAILDSSLDYNTTLQNLTRLTVPNIADWCEVVIVTEKQELHQVTLAHKDSPIADAAKRLQARYPWRLDDALGPGRSIRTAQPELIATVTQAHLAAFARDSECLHQLESLNLLSTMSVPLVVRGATLGAIFFARSNTSASFNRVDLQLAIDLAQRAALALDNARLYGDTRSAESRLRQQLDFSQTVTDNMVEGLLVTDENGIITYTNPSAQRILCLSPEEVQGQSLREVLIRHGGINQNGNLRSLLRSGMRVSLREHHFVRPDGQDVYLQYSAAPIYVNDQFNGSVFVFHDITDRRQAEAAIQRAEEERDRARMRFIQVAAHELRNPMAGVKGILSLLRRHQEAGKPLGESSHLINVMEQEIDRLAKLLSEILEAFRVQEGQLHMERKMVNLSQVITAAIHPFAIAEEKQRFHLDINADDRPVWVWGDSERLEEVLRNLISNALKYSPPESPISVQLDCAGNNATLSVTDSGMGIPPDQLNRVFEEFFRSSNLSGRDPGGIGLGLYICRDIVQRHGGRIWVESEEGTGTTFFVQLPLMQAS